MSIRHHLSRVKRLQHPQVPEYRTVRESESELSTFVRHTHATSRGATRLVKKHPRDTRSKNCLRSTPASNTNRHRRHAHHLLPVKQLTKNTEPTKSGRRKLWAFHNRCCMIRSRFTVLWSCELSNGKPKLSIKITICGHISGRPARGPQGRLVLILVRGKSYDFPPASRGDQPITHEL